MFDRARLKLTGFYLLIIMLISISFSFFIYRFLTSEINRALNMEKLHQMGVYYPAKRFIFFNDNDTVTKGIVITPPSTEILEEAKQRILYILIAVNLGIFCLSGAAGYFLAGRTLRPIKQMVDEQNRFITDASHELRTPLTSLKSEIEVSLRDKKLTLVDARKILESNLEEVNNLQYLSDNLIKLAQAKTTNGVRFEETSFLTVVNLSIKKVEKIAKKKNIVIEKNIEDALLTADRQGLTELLVILLDNAIKYSESNSKIYLSSRKSGRNLIIEVKDYGVGINKKDLPMLFERFYRADNARSKKDTEGFGLGLSIAKDIVEKHKGGIDVKSKLGQGTTFQIKLPIGS